MSLNEGYCCPLGTLFGLINNAYLTQDRPRGMVYAGRSEKSKMGLKSQP